MQCSALDIINKIKINVFVPKKLCIAILLAENGESYRFLRVLRGTFTLRERFHMTSRAAILVFKNSKTAAMLEFETNPLGIELFTYVKTFFCYNKFARNIMGDVQVAY